MKIQSIVVLCCIALIAVAAAEESVHKHKHKHHHHHKGDKKADHKGHHKHHKGHHHNHNETSAKVAAPVAAAPAHKQAEAAHPTAKAAKVALAKVQVAKAPKKETGDEKLLAKMKAIESRLAAKKKAQELEAEKGHILVSGPLPADFAKLFSQAVAQATGIDMKKVTVTSTASDKANPGVFAINFKADPKTVKAVESQATDADSKLATGNLHSFLVAKDGDDDEADEAAPKEKEAKVEAVPVEEKGIDIDTAMPYGELEPFGREDTAQELTEDSITESNQMVDQLERAEVAEEKRAVFRALTRLRGAAITSFDGVARAQTGAIDEYGKTHKWREAHPLHHLADEESDVSKWAFPDNADF